GTVLRITGLRSDWSDKALIELRDRLSRLLNPYGNYKSFQIHLKAPSPKLGGPIVPTPIEQADFEWIVNRNEGGSIQVKRRHRKKRGAPQWSAWSTVHVSRNNLDDKDEFGPVRARFFF